MAFPIVEELQSASNLVRARIRQRSDGLYDVEVEVFVKGNALNEEPNWWALVDGPKTVTDSVERARELALEGIEMDSLERARELARESMSAATSL
jgi:hypothetical protein